MIAVRWKALPWVLGVCLLAFSLVAANRLLHTQEGNGGGAPDAPPKKDPKAAPAGAKDEIGPTVLGTVDAPNGSGRVDAPALPAVSGATVVEVFVRDGQAVKVGDLLAQFDDSAYRAKLDQAEAELAGAAVGADVAQKQKDDWPDQLELQKLALRKAESDLQYGGEAVTRGREDLERLLDAEKLSDPDKDYRRRHNSELLKGEAAVASLKLAVEKERLELKRLQRKPVDADVQRAAAKVKGATAAVAEAKALIELCKLKARTAGIVERLTANPGRTFGPATREPVLFLAPTGARIVHAEVEAEFAHKIDDRVGKAVTILAGNNFGQTYEGRVTRIGTCYLPNRGSADSFAVNPTHALECEIEVIDPTPAGKPPLRLGQKVRVKFGS